MEDQDLNDELILNAQLRAETQDRPRHPGLGLDKGKGILHVRTEETPSQTHTHQTNPHRSRRPNQNKSKPTIQNKKNPSKGYGRLYPTQDDWDPNAPLNDWVPTQYTPNPEMDDSRRRPEPYHVHIDFQTKVYRPKGSQIQPPQNSKSHSQKFNTHRNVRPKGKSVHHKRRRTPYHNHAYHQHPVYYYHDNSHYAYDFYSPSSSKRSSYNMHHYRYEQTHPPTRQHQKTQRKSYHHKHQGQRQRQYRRRPDTVPRTDSVPRTELGQRNTSQRVRKVYVPKNSLQLAPITNTTHSTTSNSKDYHAVSYAYGVDEGYSIAVRERQGGIPQGN